MAEKVVSVRLIARTEGFTAGMLKAKKSVDDLTKADIPKATKGYSDLANKAALAGGAIALGLGVAVKRFAEFDAAMSSVKANVNGTTSEIEALRAAALKLGADSQFTATEAAQGINELAKAGVSTQAILGGGLKGALDLAAAGQIGVAQAAETTATALTQFKLGGNEAVHVADLLAAGANKAQGGVGDLGAALGQAGLVAAGMGLSIEETTAGLTAFASAGLIGSDAGTSFKTMIQRLQAPIGDAKQMLDKYNISAYDAQGNFVGLANVAGQLQSKFRTLTPEVRNNALAVIFGQDAIRGANVLYQEGAEGIGKWIEQVDQSGFAAKQAADLTNNLKGDIERLGGAIDTVFIGSGSGANGALRTLTQSLEGLVNNVGRIPGPVLLAGGALGSLALLAPKGIRAYREYAATMDSVGLSFDKISAKGPRAAKAVDAVTGSAKAFGTAMAILAAAGAVDSAFGTDAVRAGTDTLIGEFTTAQDAVATFSDSIRTFSDQSSDAFSVDGVKSFGDALRYTFDPEWADHVDKVVGSVASFFGATDKSRITASADALKQLDAALTGMVSAGNYDGAARIYQQFVDAAAQSGVSADEFKAKVPGYTNSLAGVDNASRKAAVGTEILGGSMDEMGGRLGEVVGQADSTSAAVLALGGAATSASDEVKDLAKSIQTDMDAAASAFTSDLDVISKYDPEKASGKLAKANKASEDAEKKLQQVRDRIAAKKKTTVSDTQALENAEAKAAEARSAKVAAANEAQGQSLGEMYRDSLAKAQKFSKDIQTASERGLDPTVVAKLLKAGPDQAGPVLEQLLSDHSGRMIRMVNESETALSKINEQVVQQARLTAIAMNATTDEVAGHLDEANRIAAAKAAAGGEITAEALAAKLQMSVPDIVQIASEFGIALKEEIPPEVGTYINLKGVDKAKDDLVTFKTTIDETVGAYVTAPGASGAASDASLFHAEVSVDTAGVPQTIDDILGVKNRLDLLSPPTTVSIRVNGVASAISQIDTLLGKLRALSGKASTTADYKAAQENIANQKKVATGGAIIGPGTGTSDSIPALLSNGEHVLTAAEVAKMGGQSAVYALRAAVRAGRMPAFAAGGAVQYAPPAQYVQVAGPTQHTQTTNAPIYIEKVVTPDVAGFRRRAEDAAFTSYVKGAR